MFVDHSPLCMNAWDLATSADPSFLIIGDNNNQSHASFNTGRHLLTAPALVNK